MTKGIWRTFDVVKRPLLLTAFLLATPAAATPGDLAAYLRARVADADGALAISTASYRQALDEAPDSPVVAIRAYRDAVRAGDLALADRAAAALAAHDVAPADAALLALAQAARDRDVAAARAAIARLDHGQLKVLAAPLRAWAAFDAGGDPLAALSARPADSVERRFVEETRALVLIAAGRSDAGLVALHALLGNDAASRDNRIAAARLLIGQGKPAPAAALLAGAPLPPAAAPSLAFGVAHLFTRVAADLAPGDPGPLSYTLLRAALCADPRADRARVLLAGVLAKDGATDRALETLRAIPVDSAEAPVAAAVRIRILAAAGRAAEALAAARLRADAPGATDDDLRRLADLHLQDARPAEAVPLYRALLDRAGPRADAGDWLQYGAALDRAGRWDQARAALERAAALAPANPVVLNYLGYALVERRERIGAAQKLLERAAALRPNDAAITDSLGWSRYVRGDAAGALPLIERAAAAEPGNAEIGEHLGDVYWRSGRRFEARYAWAAARVVADAEDVARRLARKIADGL